MERHLAAILYADVVGYSRLTGQNEEETHRKLDAGLDLLAEVIDDHHGQKVHEAGDAILAEFKSVTEAVNAALDFQRHMSARNAELAEDVRLEFRIGVNLGEVIHDRNDIYGDGVNLAARIEQLNKEHQTRVLVSGATIEYLHGSFPLEPVAEVSIRGKTKPAALFELRCDGVSERLEGLSGPATEQR